MVIVYIGTGYIQELYLGRAPRTKETLPDFHEGRRVTRHLLVFRGLTGIQRTPRNWGVINIPSRVLLNPNSSKKKKGLWFDFSIP